MVLTQSQRRHPAPRRFLPCILLAWMLASTSHAQTTESLIDLTDNNGVSDLMDRPAYDPAHRGLQ